MLDFLVRFVTRPIFHGSSSPCCDCQHFRALSRCENQQFDMIEYFVVGLVLLAIPFFISPLGRKKNVEKRENSENATTRAHYNFPDDPVLARLLASSYHKAWSSQTVIYDARGFQKSYIELLGDIIYTAHLIRSELPPSVLDKRGLLNTESCPIGILVRSGYEFIVAFFAARVMGGAAMPMGKFSRFHSSSPIRQLT